MSDIDDLLADPTAFHASMQKHVMDLVSSLAPIDDEMAPVPAQVFIAVSSALAGIVLILAEQIRQSDPENAKALLGADLKTWWAVNAPPSDMDKGPTRH